MKLSTVGQIAAWLWVLLVVLVAIGVPYFSIIATSLIRLRGYGLAAGNFTLDHCKELLQTPKALSSIWKSLFLAVSSATICSVIGTAVVVAVRKSRGFFKKALEGISLLPEMLPSIVLVIGLMLFEAGLTRCFRFITRSGSWCWPTWFCIFPTRCSM